MRIIQLPFEEKMVLSLKDKTITLTVFKTEERGNIKIGVVAPKEVSINREEIYFQKKQNEQTTQ